MRVALRNRVAGSVRSVIAPIHGVFWVPGHGAVKQSILSEVRTCRL